MVEDDENVITASCHRAPACGECGSVCSWSVSICLLIVMHEVIQHYCLLGVNFIPLNICGVDCKLFFCWILVLKCKQLTV